ncbi:MAG: sigma-70 family RNA polymerase sigma factor, partial [Cyanobacteria bacterium P01_A01_bin.135]
GWIADPHLHRSMRAAQDWVGEQLEQRSGGAEVQFWATYWHRRWRAGTEDNQSSLPYRHLTALVQEACYWAAQRTMRFAVSQYGLADYFQLAIARFDYVLQHFSPAQGSRLDAYAYTAFCNIIRDTLRQRKELDISSDWAVLRRVSQKRLKAALKAEGLKDIDPYILAWRCYRLVHVPSSQTQPLGQPEAEDWQAMVYEFNQQRQAMTPLPPRCDEARLRQWLGRCAAAVRVYLYPKVTSLNISKPGRNSGELQDTLVDQEERSPLDLALAEEEATTRHQQQLAVDQVLRTALQQLSDEAQTILLRYYQQGQTQQQIAEALGLKQYTISRRLSKVRESLLKQVLLWSQDSLHISVTSDVVVSMTAVLEEWLYRYYAAQP